jgi:hypothetical protein
MRQEAPCMEIRSSHRESRTGKRRELVEKRRVLRLLTNPEVRRKILFVGRIGIFHAGSGS